MDDVSAFFERLGVVTRLPLDSLAAIVELRSTIDRVEGLLVGRARAGGATWTEIGAALGVSRQAAHARHRPLVKDADGDSPRPFA